MAIRIDASLLNPVPAGSDGLLVLDLQGKVCSCDGLTAERFGSSEADLVERPIASLIPALPFRPNTPGYNVAYTSLWFPSGTWRTLLGLKPDGQSFPLQLSAAMLRMKDERRIVLGLRQPAVDSATRKRLPDQEQTSAHDAYAAT